MTMWKNGGGIVRMTTAEINQRLAQSNPKIQCAKKFKSIPYRSIPSEAIFKHHCAAISAYARQRKLPLPLSKKNQLFESCDLGRPFDKGAYGAVYPTEQKGVVMKLTADESEAHFIRTAMTLYKKGIKPSGLVEYYDIVALRAKHEGHQVFVVWREEVEDPGLDCGYGWQESFCDQISTFVQEAHRLRKYLFKAFNDYGGGAQYWAFVETDTYAQKLIIAIEDQASSVKDTSVEGWFVGAALKQYAENGLVIADAHTGNIGLAIRGSNEQYVIFDPGHAVVLDRKLCTEEIVKI